VALLDEPIRCPELQGHTAQSGPSGSSTPRSATAAPPGMTIDEFDIIKPISRGAFGRVYLARKHATGDLFAIKVMKKRDLIRKNMVESVNNERNILALANNPFVVRFYYSFTSKENLYIVMEYLNGGDCFSLLRKFGCLDEEVARLYVAEAVLALEYCHAQGIIHRDMKPDNMLISANGHVKLTDFGLSCIGVIDRTDTLEPPLVLPEPQLDEDGHSCMFERWGEQAAWLRGPLRGTW
ncbi:serine/threonine protein kinase 15, partial [Haematococcus lacustris]